MFDKSHGFKKLSHGPKNTKQLPLVLGLSFSHRGCVPKYLGLNCPYQ